MITLQNPNTIGIDIRRSRMLLKGHWQLCGPYASSICQIWGRIQGWILAYLNLMIFQLLTFYCAIMLMPRQNWWVRFNSHFLFMSTYQLWLDCVQRTYIKKYGELVSSLSALQYFSEELLSLLKLVQTHSQFAHTSSGMLLKKPNTVEIVD